MSVALNIFNSMVAFICKAKGLPGKGKGKPGEIRYWESAKTPANPAGAVFRLPDPPKVKGMPAPTEDSLWKPIDQLAHGSAEHSNVLQFKKNAADKLYKDAMKDKVSLEEAISRFSNMVHIAEHLGGKSEDPSVQKALLKLVNIRKSLDGLEEFAAKMAIAKGAQDIGNLWEKLTAAHKPPEPEKKPALEEKKPEPPKETKPEEEKKPGAKKYPYSDLPGVENGLLAWIQGYGTGAISAEKMKTMLEVTHNNLKKNVAEIFSDDYDMYGFMKDKLDVFDKWMKKGKYDTAADRLRHVAHYLQDYGSDYKKSIPSGYTAKPDSIEATPAGYHMPIAGDPDGLLGSLGFRVGTVRQWADGKYIKSQEGWIPLVSTSPQVPAEETPEVTEEKPEEPKKKPKAEKKPEPDFDPVAAWEEAKAAKAEAMKNLGIPSEGDWSKLVQEIKTSRAEFKSSDESGKLTENDISAAQDVIDHYASQLSEVRDKLKISGGETSQKAAVADDALMKLKDRLSAAKSAPDQQTRAKKLRSALEKADNCATSLKEAISSAWFVPKPKMPSKPKPPVAPVAPDMAIRRGGVIFDDKGRVLLVKPKGAYGGYKWSLPKGTMEKGETAEQAALREVFEETGLKCEVVRSVPGIFAGATSTNSYYIMRAAKEGHGKPGEETESVKWVTPEEAIKHIEENPTTHRRDVEVLREASKHHRAAPTFPDSLDNLEIISSLGGTTGAKLVKDKNTGQKFVMKRGKDQGHIEEEISANLAYAALGVSVPAVKRYESKEGVTMLAEHIEGEILSKYISDHPEEKGRIYGKLRRDFVADALLGNIDVVGLEHDNILIDKHGEPVRIDNGGSFRRRARGGMKHTLPGGAKNWDGYPMALWTLRDESRNASCAKVFKGTPFRAILGQIAEVTSPENRAQLMKSIPAELHKDVDSRINSLRDVHKVGSTLLADNHVEDYTDGFCMHVVGIGQHGITGMMPEELEKSSSTDVILMSEGKQFGNLRTHGGEKSVVGEFADYIKEYGGDHKFVREWHSGQGGSSWGSNAIAAKIFFSKAVKSDYYWNGDTKEESYRDGIWKGFCGSNEKGAIAALSAYHALVHEFLRNTALPGSDRSRGVIRIFRSESVKALKTAESQSGQKLSGDADIIKVRKELAKPKKQWFDMTHGACESHSLVRPVYLKGMYLTEKVVPFHRVLGMYAFESYPGSGSCCLYGDSENEVLANAADIPFVIIGNNHDGKADEHAENMSLLQTGEYKP